MGKKIIPLFTSERDEDADYKKFKDSLEDIDIEKAISICKISKDAKGHNTPLAFRMPDISLRIIGEIKSKEKRFECDSDVLRTCHILGLSVISNFLKKGGVIGDALDDCIFALNKANEIVKNEEMYEILGNHTLKSLRQLAKIFKKRRPIFNRKAKEMENELKRVKDLEWKDYLLKEFEKEVSEIKKEMWPEDE